MTKVFVSSKEGSETSLGNTSDKLDGTFGPKDGANNQVEDTAHDESSMCEVPLMDDFPILNPKRGTTYLRLRLVSLSHKISFLMLSGIQVVSKH